MSNFEKCSMRPVLPHFLRSFCFVLLPKIYQFKIRFFCLKTFKSGNTPSTSTNRTEME